MKGRTGVKGLQAQIFLRSLYVQSSWNFERLQNLGFAFMSYPVLADKYGSGTEELGRSLKRHLDFFNTNPYFAGLVAASVAREDGGDLDSGSFITDLKRSLMSTMGSIGDGFFWATLRPLAALAALVPAIFGFWWAPLVLLTLFNIPHLWLRWWGIGVGLQQGSRVIGSIEALGLQRKAAMLAPAAALFAGLCAGAAAGRPDWAPVPGSTVLSAAAAAALLLAGMAVSAKGIAGWGRFALLVGALVLMGASAS